QLGLVQLYDADTHTLRIAASRGFTATFEDMIEARAEEASVMGEAVRRMARVVASDLHDSPVYIDPQAIELLERAGVRAIQSTPLVSRDGRVLGLLSTAWEQVHRPEAATLRHLDLLAREAADLVEHRQREDALRRARDAAAESSRLKDEF